jgi:ATP-dependent DNA helicase RecQ
VLKEKHKADYLINFLLGKDTSEIETFEHNELEEFGSGSDEEESTWETVIRQALLDNYLKKDIENYGILKITKKGKEFLKKPLSFKITKEEDEDDADIEELESEEGVITTGGGNSGAADPALFSMMKDLRKKISKKLNVPPYVIFQPASLEAMATSYPITLEELQNIPGVGAGKAKRYGQEFIELIKKHVEENEIIRPEDLRVKTVANKSKLKVSIVQAIDRKVALDDLAESKGIDFNEMLSEVEAIVYSGTKININYFLEEVMDADTVREIYEYFRETETDNLDKAMDELPDYSETEIRLVRIKFFSEMAN